MQITFDQYLSERIGLGKHQIFAFLILSIIEFMEGFKEVYVGTQVTLLTNEWQLSDTQQMILGSMFYAGGFVGNSFCSLLADLAGRRVMLLISQTCTVAALILNSYVTNFAEVLIILFVYGVIFGVAMAITQVMVSESVPLQYRGRFIVSIQFIYMLGCVYLIGCFYIFLDSYTVGDWRNMLRYNTIPAILALVLSIFFLKESPRLYIAKGEYERGFAELDIMGRSNNQDYLDITEDEKNAIMLWRESKFRLQMEARSFGGLFHGVNLRITITIWVIFCFYNVVSSGIQVITPYILEESNSGFLPSLLSYIAEILAIIFVVSLIDNEKWGGRKKCQIYGLVMLSLVQLAVWYFEKSFLAVGQILQRFAIRIVWLCFDALPVESYTTVYRSMGVGAAQGIGKVAGALSPFPILWLYYRQVYLPFIVCAGLCIVTLGFVLSFPANATQKPLDKGKSSIHPSEAIRTSNIDNSDTTSPLLKQ